MRGAYHAARGPRQLHRVGTVDVCESREHARGLRALAREQCGCSAVGAEAALLLTRVARDRRLGGNALALHRHRVRPKVRARAVVRERHDRRVEVGDAAVTDDDGRELGRARSRTHCYAELLCRFEVGDVAVADDEGHELGARDIAHCL